MNHLHAIKINSLFQTSGTKRDDKVAKDLIHKLVLLQILASSQMFYKKKYKYC